MRKLEYFENELGSSPAGRDILGVVRSHVEEVSRLVNTNRAVMVAWQRNKGPRFLMAAMGGDFTADTPFTKEIDGVALDQLLLRMADALQQNGSPGLAAAVGRYAAPVMTAASECTSVADVFRRIRAGGL
jgi:hypothetical protein